MTKKSSSIYFQQNQSFKKLSTFKKVLLPSALMCSAQVFAAELWEMSLEELGKVRVTAIASGTLTPIDKAAAIATVITEDDIDAMGATDLDQVLEAVPGLHVSRSEQAYTAKYIIRGITSTFNPQTLVLINGIPVTSLFTGNRGNIWAGMPIKAIARIEVIRGPGSALYGADAFAGVINIITKSGADLKGTTAAVRAGSFNTQAASLEHGGKYGGFDVGFTLEAETTDGWNKTVTADAQSGFDQLPFINTHASLAPGKVNTMKDMVDARLDISGASARLRAGYQGRYHVGSSVGYGEALDPSSRIRSERYNLDYSYSLKDLTPDWEADARVSYYRNTQEVEKNIYLYPRGASIPVPPFDKQSDHTFPDGVIGNPGYQEENARVDLSSLYKGFADHFVRIGAGFTWDDMFEVTETKNFTVDVRPRPNGVETVTDTAEVYLPESQRKNYYLFAQDEWKFADNWQATTGVRYDHFSDFGDTTNPRLALVWAATDKITTKLLYGKAFRAPSFAELFATSNPLQQGNPNLKPETIDTYELAFSHQLSTQLLYSANIYHYSIKDLINFVPSATGATAQNVGKRRGHGLELETDYSPVYNLRFLINYGYQQSEDSNTNSDVGGAPTHQIYTRSEWTVTPGWHVDSQVTWVGKQQRAATDSRSALASYTTVDVTLRKQDVIDGLDAALSVHNLFNADVREPSSTGFISNDFPMAGRSIYGEVNYRF